MCLRGRRKQVNSISGVLPESQVWRQGRGQPFPSRSLVMSRPLFLGLILAALGNCESDDVKKDIAALQGQWKVKWLEQDGKKVEVRERICTFRGKKCKWSFGAPKEKPLEASFEIDPSCTPKTIDYQSSVPAAKGAKKEGIY